MSDSKFLMGGSAVTFRHYEIGALFLHQGHLNQYCPYKKKGRKAITKLLGEIVYFLFSSRRKRFEAKVKTAPKATPKRTVLAA